jgi:Flp pilus assembly protein TadD
MEQRTRLARLASVPSRQRLARFSAVCLMAVAVAGCSSRLGQFTGSLTDVGRSATPPMAESLEQLGRTYDAKPGEKRSSLAYAAALRAGGQHGQAVAVLLQASIRNVGDRDIAAAYGKALADVGRFAEAMKVLAQAHSADRPDWRVLSTQGAISDQMGEHTRAREFYNQALQIAPNEPAVLTNLALSHVLTRELAEAERLLQRAASQPNAGPRVQANLQLVQSLRQQARAEPQPRAVERKQPVARASSPTASRPADTKAAPTR